MSIAQQVNARVSSLLMTLYLMVDRIIPYLVKFTFPLWAVPVLGGMCIYKVLHFWRRMVRLLNSLVHPNSTPQLVFALVKGNGRYLRSSNQNVLVHQFYDYTSRRFMNIAELQAEATVVELECHHTAGLQFLARTCSRGKVTGMARGKTIHSQGLNSFIEPSDYQLSGQGGKVDLFLLFNYKSKANMYQEEKLDLMQLLNYCQHHLNSEGCLVFGDYFEKGEAVTFKLMFESFGLKIVDEEDITRNIEYAKKLMASEEGEYEVEVLESIRKRVLRLLRRESYSQGRQFHVFILERSNSDNQS